MMATILMKMAQWNYGFTGNDMYVFYLILKFKYSN